MTKTMDFVNQEPAPPTAAEFSWARPGGYPEIPTEFSATVWRWVRRSLLIVVPIAVVVACFLAGSPFASAAGSCGGG